MSDGYQSYLASDTWAAKRDAVRLRALGRCEFCGDPMDHVHHVRYPKRLGDESLDDLIAVCARCHDKTHGVRKMKNLQPIPDARVLDVTAPSGYRLTIAASTNGNAYAPLRSWMEAIEVPAFKLAQFEATVTGHAMTADAGSMPVGTFNGQQVYSWQVICFALRACDRKYHAIGEPNQPMPAGFTVEQYGLMKRFIKNIDTITRWGWDLQSRAIANRFSAMVPTTPAPRAPVPTVPDMKLIRMLAAGIVQHDERIGALESATLRRGDEPITVADGCLELNLDEHKLIDGGLNLAGKAGMVLKERGSLSVGKTERRLHASGIRVSTNNWLRRDVYKVIGELVGKDFGHLLIDAATQVR